MFSRKESELEEDLFSCNLRRSELIWDVHNLTLLGVISNSMVRTLLSESSFIHQSLRNGS
jgi:hypothetical protein